MKRNYDELIKTAHKRNVLKVLTQIGFINTICKYTEIVAGTAPNYPSD